MPITTDVYVCEILDSRGNPTIEVEVYTESGAFGRGMVPSGALTGEYKAAKLRDEDKARYGGKGVTKAVDNVNNITAEAIINYDIRDQIAVDKAMIVLDGTPSKGRSGANVILGVSIAVARTAADYLEVPLRHYLGEPGTKVLPTPMMNVINSEPHAGNSAGFQEFVIMPVGAPAFKETLRMGTEAFHALTSILETHGLVTSVGDEGGLAPNLGSNKGGFEAVIEAAEKTGYIPDKNAVLTVNATSSGFYDKEKSVYVLAGLDEGKKTTDEMIRFCEELVSKYPIISIGGGLDESDWDGFKKLTDVLGNEVQLVDDDLSITNTQRLLEGIGKGIVSSILTEVNQIGTLAETFKAIEAAKETGCTIVASHRPDEAEGSAIPDIAVATNAGQIKTGSLSRTDRVARYNQLLRIGDQLGGVAGYKGLKSFYNLRNK